MALQQSALPAPLRLKPSQTTLLTHHQAHASLSEFLQNDQSSLLVGQGVLRASLQRLLQGLKEDLQYPVASTVKKDAGRGGAEEGDKKKKRRKSDAAGEGKKKKRKTEA